MILIPSSIQRVDDVSVPNKKNDLLAKENTQKSLASAHSSHLEFTSSSLLSCLGELIIKNVHLPKGTLTLKHFCSGKKMINLIMFNF